MCKFICICIKHLTVDNRPFSMNSFNTNNGRAKIPFSSAYCHYVQLVKSECHHRRLSVQGDGVCYCKSIAARVTPELTWKSVCKTTITLLSATISIKKTFGCLRFDNQAFCRRRKMSTKVCDVELSPPLSADKAFCGFTVVLMPQSCACLRTNQVFIHTLCQGIVSFYHVYGQK